MREKLTGILFILVGALMFALCLGMVFGVAAEQLAADRERDAIQKLLDGQTRAWSQGDLDGFMAGYQRSPELSFYSGGEIRQGWEIMRQRYRDRYQAGNNTMGKLQFSDVHIELTGP